MRNIILLAACLALIVPAPALAGLFATQFGFPVVARESKTVAFSSDMATATGLEILDIDFPAFDGLMGGSQSPGIGLGPAGGPGLFREGLFDFPRFLFA